MDVDHATGGPGVQSVPVDALVLGLEVVRGRSLVVLPVQRLHGRIGPAHDELADRVHAVVWEKWRALTPRGISGVVTIQPRLTGVRLCWDSGRFVVVIAVDIMVDVFLFTVIGVSGPGEENLRRSGAHDIRLQTNHQLKIHE